MIVPRLDRSGSAEPGQAVAIIGTSQAIRDLVVQATRVATTDVRILITGESGVGKDLLARLVHAESGRSGRPFVAVNCAGLAETILESELFGHVRGSFTGAYRDKAGLLQNAHLGTLFLDEVGEMSFRMQALLLRFLETGEIQPVGAEHPTARADVRIISATNRNLDEAVAAARFREDLLYRLRVVHVHVPPLRERPEDVEPLIEHFARGAASACRFSPAALSLLRAYRWPGNVRELQNVVERTLALSDTTLIDPEHLPSNIRTSAVRFVAKHERRRQVADDLYQALTEGACSFWEHIHPMFLSRDITRHDLRELVRKGLAKTRGNYRAVLRLYGMADGDYKKFLNFLAAHDCTVDFRPFRTTSWQEAAVPRIRTVPLPGDATSGAAGQATRRPPGDKVSDGRPAGEAGERIR